MQDKEDSIGISRYLRKAAAKRNDFKAIKNLQKREAMIIEEENDVNMQGTEYVGSIADIWVNLEKLEEQRIINNKDPRLYPDVENYVAMNLFPVNSNPYVSGLMQMALQKLGWKFNPPGNPNLVQVPMVYEKLMIRECLMNSRRYHRLLVEVKAV